MKKVLLIMVAAFSMTMLSCGNGTEKTTGFKSDDTWEGLVSDTTETISDAVYITPKGHRYHREYCPRIKGHPVTAVSRDEAENRGRTPCKVCYQ